MIEKDKNIDIQKISKANTKILGKDIEYYEIIESTQEVARVNLKKQIKHGNIVIADIQTNGKGTNGRKWYTGKRKNISMTITLCPKCTIEELKDVTIEIANCIKESIKELYGCNLQIKYPNDLFLNEKKICGILTQSSSCEEKVSYLLIGIGFNVNETDFNEETSKIATSLKKELGREFSREDIIKEIFEKMEQNKLIKNIIF